jgi:site-specific DNA-methyltransferase (adenine-specific)
MKDLSDNSIDCFICDLPYGCLSAKGNTNIYDKNVKSGKRVTGGVHDACAWDVKINLEEFWKEIRRIRKNDHSPCIHFCTTRFGYELIQSNPAEFRYDLVWNKQRGVSFLSANKMPMRSHEMIYVFSKAGAFYHRIDEDAPGKKKDTGNVNTIHRGNVYMSANSKLYRGTGADDKACVLSVINMKKSGTFKQSHPTEKLNELYQWLIERYCPVGGTVLDPTFGSGNSVFTAYGMGRNAIGIEMNEEFFNKAVERMNTDF